MIYIIKRYNTFVRGLNIPWNEKTLTNKKALRINSPNPGAEYVQKQPRALRTGCDPASLEDPAPFTVEMGRYRKHGDLLRNSYRSITAR